MKYLVTGANGFIGSRLCERLSKEGNEVVALCRRKVTSVYLDHENTSFAIGDLQDVDSLLRAMDGCDRCFHLAGKASQWARDPKEFFRVNVEGTRNVLQAAVESNVSKLVCTSTAGVFGPSTGTGVINENSPLPEKLNTAYEQSKRRAEQIVLDFVDKRDMDVCIVSPTRVFGPGTLTEANGLTRIMKQFSNGSWRILPGDGKSIGNYVFIDDVVDGHLKAMESGRAGRKYILGGQNISFLELFEFIRNHSLIKRRMYKVPFAAINVYALLQLGLAECFGVSPALTPAFAKRYRADYRLSSLRAQEELGYHPMGIEKAIAKTMRWLAEDNPDIGQV